MLSSYLVPVNHQLTPSGPVESSTAKQEGAGLMLPSQGQEAKSGVNRVQKAHSPPEGMLPVT